MNKLVEVKLWGTTIGYLGYLDDTGVAQFEYDKSFISSNIYPSPSLMKYPPIKHRFDNISFNTFKGLPGIFADSLPDKFGNQLIDIFMAEKKIPKEDITAIDRLLYIGNRGMGAIEYHPFEFEDDFIKNQTVLDIHTLSELAELSLTKKDELHKKLTNASTRKDALNIIKIGSSAGGARAKALIAIDEEGKYLDGSIIHNNLCTYWLLKFDSDANKDRDSGDPKGMTIVEYIYSLLAKKCNINIPRTDYIIDGDDFHFLIERFDRILVKEKTSKLHYISWAGLSHNDRDKTGAYSYEQLVMDIRSIGLGQDSIDEIFRRAVFNIVSRNQDDHTKNFGFLMNKKGEWNLSPAFDLTYSYDPTGRWTKVHQIKLNGKQDNFTKEDIINFAKYCNIKKETALSILNHTQEVFKEFEDLAIQYNVDKDLYSLISKNLRTKI